MSKAKIFIKEMHSIDDFNWNYATEISYNKYSITESDFRNKTASFETDTLFDLSKSTYAIRIVSDSHENFAGVILRKNPEADSPCSYECQDFNRAYMIKPYVLEKGAVYDIIKNLLNYVSRKKFIIKGLLPINKYEQRPLGAKQTYNPMKTNKTIVVKDKTIKEMIISLIYEKNPLIDIHLDSKGVIKFVPLKLKEWLKPMARFNLDDVVSLEYNFDTTDIQTSIAYEGKVYRYEDLFKSKNDLSMRLLNIWSNYTDETDAASANADTKNSDKNDKTNNVYGTKNKEVWVTMDRAWSNAKDSKYLKTFCKILEKKGWKVHNMGVDPGIQTDPNKFSQCKNGIWLVLNNGADPQIFRHLGHDRWFKKVLRRNNARPVLGFIGNSAGDIRQGGKYYKSLPPAHDGTGKGNPTLRYPAGYLAECGVPFFYSKGDNPEDAAAIFESGGSSKMAVEQNYKKTRVGGFYDNWNWGCRY